MSKQNTVGSSGWTIADRVATAVLTTLQCAIFLVIMVVVPSSHQTLDPSVVGAILVGCGAVAIGGPIVIAVTIGLACRAFYRDRMSFSVPLAGILALTALYIFPIILVTAVRK